MDERDGFLGGGDDEFLRAILTGSLWLWLLLDNSCKGRCLGGIRRLCLSLSLEEGGGGRRGGGDLSLFFFLFIFKGKDKGKMKGDEEM